MEFDELQKRVEETYQRFWLVSRVAAKDDVALHNRILEAGIRHMRAYAELVLRLEEESDDEE